MLFLKIFFFAGLAIVFYSYLGYGILVWSILKLRNLLGLSRRRRIAAPSEPVLPRVTLVTAAFNEQDCIAEKIKNTLGLDYPRENLEFIFITDGSSDATSSIASGFEGITVLHQPERKGKIAAIHRAMDYVTTPIVIFSDANALLNKDCVRRITAHYRFPEVGGVAGEKKILTSKQDQVAGSGEGLYWRYESFLKKLDADLYTVVGAAGELFSIRSELYEPVDDDVILDDFIISLNICKKGFRIAYEPGAYALETPSASLSEERKRKIRISAGGFQSIYKLRGLLNIFKSPLLSFQFISHRVLRWALCPMLLPLVFVLNAFLVAYQPSTLYVSLMVGQALFYLAAATGWFLSIKGIKVKLLYVPYYFVFQNICLYYGFIKYRQRKQTVLWDKAIRQEYTITPNN